MSVKKRTVRGRVFTLVRRDQYAREWRGTCAVCGASYVTVTGRNNGNPAVRCATCRDAGKATPAQVKAGRALGRRAKRKPTAAQVAARRAFGEWARDPSPARVAARLARGQDLGARAKCNPTPAQLAARQAFGEWAKGDAARQASVERARNPTPAQVAARRDFGKRAAERAAGRRREQAQAAIQRVYAKRAMRARLEQAQELGLDLGAAAVTDWILNGGVMPSGVQKVT